MAGTTLHGLLGNDKKAGSWRFSTDPKASEALQHLNDEPQALDGEHGARRLEDLAGNEEERGAWNLKMHETEVLVPLIDQETPTAPKRRVKSSPHRVDGKLVRRASQANLQGSSNSLCELVIDEDWPTCREGRMVKAGLVVLRFGVAFSYHPWFRDGEDERLVSSLCE